MRDNLPDSLLSGLVALLCVDDGADLSGRSLPQTSSVAFDGFEVVHHIKDDVLISAAGLRDLTEWPIDISLAIAPGSAALPADCKPLWMFNRFVTLRPENWRGRLSRTFPRMVEHHWAIVGPDGLADQGVGPIGIAGDQFVIAAARARNYVPRVEGSGGYQGISRLLPGFILRREYLWSVLLGEGNGPRARFVTDPCGVREAFALRDALPGRQRRSALRHWVSEHWRNTGRDSAADRAWVREHLRGATEFTWNGLRCRIEPSRDDLRRNLESPT